MRRIPNTVCRMQCAVYEIRYTKYDNYDDQNQS